MTNFQPQKSAAPLRWLTPERALFVLPVLVSLALATAIVVLLVDPMWRSFRDRQEVVEALTIKSLALPQLQKDLKVKEQVRLRLQEQESRLLSLLAGTNDLDTFLAELNQLAVRHQVTVTTTEPGEIEAFVAVPEDQASADLDPQLQEVDDSVTTDVLLQEGLERRSASLTVQGEFKNVLAFLQDLESLQIFVITSDLDIKAIRSSGTAAGSAEKLLTSLKLQLSAYGRAPQRQSKSVVDAEQLP